MLKNICFPTIESIDEIQPDATPKNSCFEKLTYAKLYFAEHS